MNAFLNNTTFLVLTLFAVNAHAQQQSSMELTCRAKAKEVAAETYSNCVTEARNTQIDQIRKDYQKQLTDLKAKYDRELKKIGGKSLTNAPAPAAPRSTPPVASTLSTGAPPKPTKGIAKTLPTRKEMKPSTPVPEVKESPVVTAPESSSPAGENQPTQNDANGEMKIELVPAPASSDNNTASTADQTY
jgi:hypothetical protein